MGYREGGYSLFFRFMARALRFRLDQPPGGGGFGEGGRCGSSGQNGCVLTGGFSTANRTSLPGPAGIVFKVQFCQS